MLESKKPIPVGACLLVLGGDVFGEKTAIARL